MEKQRQKSIRKNQGLLKMNKAIKLQVYYNKSYERNLIMSKLDLNLNIKLTLNIKLQKKVNYKKIKEILILNQTFKNQLLSITNKMNIIRTQNLFHCFTIEQVLDFTKIIKTLKDYQSMKQVENSNSLQPAQITFITNFYNN